MITKGIIKGKVEGSLNKYLVRIPIFEGSGNSAEIDETRQALYEATLCYTPGNIDSYVVDDVVYVSFEDNNLTNAIIIGKLYLGSDVPAVGQQNISSLNVSGSANINGNVKINGIDVSMLPEHNQAIENLNELTHDLQKTMPDITLGDWVVKVANDNKNLNFFRKRDNN